MRDWSRGRLIDKHGGGICHFDQDIVQPGFEATYLEILRKILADGEVSKLRFQLLAIAIANQRLDRRPRIPSTTYLGTACLTSGRQT